MGIVQVGYYFQFVFDIIFKLVFVIDYFGIFCNCYVVYNWYLVYVYKGFEIWVKDWAVYVMFVRVGVVEDEDFDVLFCICFYDVVQGGNVGVKVYFYILNVENYDIQALQLGRFWFFIVVVEGNDGQFGLFVFVICYCFFGISCVLEVMFWCEDLFDVDVLSQECIYQMCVVYC